MHITDWPSAPSLLSSYVAMGTSEALRTAYDSLVSIRRANRGDTPVEASARRDFLGRYASGFASWVLQNIKSSHVANRQLMYNTFVAKFFGLSRTGISRLADMDILAPLTSMDRAWKRLLQDYRVETRYLACLVLGGGRVLGWRRMMVLDVCVCRCFSVMCWNMTKVDVVTCMSTRESLFDHTRRERCLPDSIRT